jgi:hypothetical protein
MVICLCQLWEMYSSIMCRTSNGYRRKNLYHEGLCKNDSTFSYILKDISPVPLYFGTKV